MNNTEYETFRKEVKACRDKFFAHKDISAQGLVFPDIEKCCLMMEELRQVLAEIVNEWHKLNPNNMQLNTWVDYYR